jgi:hypothetical protein
VRLARGCFKLRNWRGALGTMDRYLLLVIWGEGKFPSAVSGETELGPEVSSVEGTEKQPGECWAD